MDAENAYVKTDPSEHSRDANRGAVFRWGERISAPTTIEREDGRIILREGKVYLRRWVFEPRWFSIRVHHFTCSDDERHFHDHPWWFVTFVLKGGYTDVSPAGRDHLGRFSVRFRPALHRHTVEIDEGGVWTFVISGPKVRHWGFWVGEKFVKANKFFMKYGHHPCQ